MLFHPNMASRYHSEIRNLIASLTDPAARGGAARILRSLIDKIVLTPRDDGQHLSVDLIGDLAGILSIATREDRPVVEKELLKFQPVMGNDGRKKDAEKYKSQENWAILAMVAAAGFRRQDYANTEIKEISGSSQTAAAFSKPRFINVAWNIGPRAAAA